jgi:hypothetical protein
MSDKPTKRTVSRMVNGQFVERVVEVTTLTARDIPSEYTIDGLCREIARRLDQSKAVSK